VSEYGLRSALRTARRRLDWRTIEIGPDPELQRGVIARTLAYLFGFGAILLGVTLMLPGAPGRDELALAVVAAIALLVAVGLLTSFDRTPMWVLILAPAAGSLLVGAVIRFAGPEASAAYALYFAWVVIAAANYLSRTATALHGIFAVAVYAAAIQIAGPGPAPTGVQLAMLAGTAAVAAYVMAGLAVRVRELVRRLEDDANTDPLTGLDNRRALHEQFKRELARAARSRRPLALIVCDLDLFKRFNDAHGHLVGDDALRRVARVLDEITRQAETAARIGGEEFAVLAPDTDEPGAVALAERLRIAIDREFADERPPLTISCGIAIHHPGRRAASDLFDAADQALYTAKEAGRNRVEVARDQYPLLELAGLTD
jgi:diguanylate cyclase (GGDEF)-like protein